MPKELTYEQALFRASALCTRYEKCESDIRTKLAEWGIAENDVNKIIAYLKEEKYLDEARYCAVTVKRTLRYNKWGRKKIAYSLQMKKIDSDFIYAALDEIDETEYQEILQNLLSSKNKTIKAKSDYEKKAKLFNFALSHGFESDEIKTALKTLSL